jgi:GcrA cell cycle regulator
VKILRKPGDSEIMDERNTMTTREDKGNWTADRVELLKKLWAEGHSASQIAGKLGMGVTRNAVIGKVHRLSLAGRATAPKTPRPATAPTSKLTADRRVHRPVSGLGGGAAAAPREEYRPSPRIQPEPKPIRLVDLPKDGRITILHLSDKTCRWPIGEPNHDDFCFCGHNPREGSPYCEYHARLAYQPANDRRMRRFG